MAVIPRAAAANSEGKAVLRRRGGHLLDLFVALRLHNDIRPAALQLRSEDRAVPVEVARLHAQLALVDAGGDGADISLELLDKRATCHVTFFIE